MCSSMVEHLSNVAKALVGSLGLGKKGEHKKRKGMEGIILFGKNDPSSLQLSYGQEVWRKQWSPNLPPHLARLLTPHSSPEQTCQTPA